MNRILWGILGAAMLAACSAPAPDTSRFAREDRACAEIGVARGDPDYAYCVGNLDAALYNQDLLPTGE